VTAEADEVALNRAAPIRDGQRIYVPRPGETVPAGSAGSDAQLKIDVNHATAAELEALPGIGPTTAARIVRSRGGHPFTRNRGAADPRPGDGARLRRPKGRDNDAVTPILRTPLLPAAAGGVSIALAVQIAARAPGSPSRAPRRGLRDPHAREPPTERAGCAGARPRSCCDLNGQGNGHPARSRRKERRP